MEARASSPVRFEDARRNPIRNQAFGTSTGEDARASIVLRFTQS